MIEDMFVKGGIFMWPLLLSLVVTLVILIERCLYWIKVKFETNHQFRESLITNIANNLSNSGRAQLDKAAQLAIQAFKQNRFSQPEIENLLKQRQVSQYRFMRTLDVITSVAPLLGILGTIWGIINSFKLAGNVIDIDPTTAMLGMSEAFITTAFGLVVSLSALFAYNYFQSLSERELINNDIFLTKVLVMIDSNE